MMASPGVASVMMDAAQALLLQGNAAGVVPQTPSSTNDQGMDHPNQASSCVTTASTACVEEGRGRAVSAENELMETDGHACSGVSSAAHSVATGTSCAGTITTSTSTNNPPATSGGDFASSDALDALAALASATSEVRNASVDDDDDDDDDHEEERHDTLGPLIASRSPSPEQIKSGSPASSSRPRAMMGRLRSVSNPEGMEKWDSMGRSNNGLTGHSATSHRRHFVLPSSILEEELADAQMAVERGLGRRYRAYSSGHMFNDDPHHHPYVEDEPDYMDAAPLRISPDVTSAEATLDETEESEEEEGDDEEEEGSGDEEDGEEDSGDEAAEAEEEEEDTSNLSPEELLRRARARLLEDVSTAGGSPAGTSVASRGVLPLPHSLGKYKNVSLLERKGKVDLGPWFHLLWIICRVYEYNI